MTGNIIYLSAAAKTTRDLTMTYRLLFESLVESLSWQSQTTSVLGIHQAVEILIPEANVELKEQTYQNILGFVKSFSDKTGLTVIELS